MYVCGTGLLCYLQRRPCWTALDGIAEGRLPACITHRLPTATRTSGKFSILPMCRRKFFSPMGRAVHDGSSADSIEATGPRMWMLSARQGLFGLLRDRLPRWTAYDQYLGGRSSNLHDYVAAFSVVTVEDACSVLANENLVASRQLSSIACGVCMHLECATRWP